MWIGKLPFTVSVEKILRKSCGVNLSGLPSRSTKPVSEARFPSNLRMCAGSITRRRFWKTVWNKRGSGGPSRRSWGS